MSRLIAAVALAAAIVALAIGQAGARQDAAVKGPLVTPNGVGGLKLGRTIAQLRALRLIGGAHRGCELAPGEKAARLKAPLTGTAIFYPAKRLSAISLTGSGETAAGIHVGSTAAAARAAYPAAPYEKPHVHQPIPVGFIWIGGKRHPKMTLVIAPLVLNVMEIAIPSPSFCE